MLEVIKLRGGYGDGDVLREVSLSVSSAEIVTVAGTNGSGKSTMGKALMGLLPRCSGSILFDQVNLGNVATHERLGMGMCYVPQVANVFPSLTVLENLQVVHVKGGASRISTTLERFPSLSQRVRNRAGTLSGGERQQLAMARAIVSGARFMILDEPTANLAPKVVDEVFALIASMPLAGVSVLLIEQRAREALAISHRGYVMHLGEIVAHGFAAELLSDARLGELFFGGVESESHSGAGNAGSRLDSENLQ